MLVLTISASTTDEAIAQAIPFPDMRAHALAGRGGADRLELHEVAGVTVLLSPIRSYAYVNELGPATGDSMLISHGCTGADHAAAVWRCKAAGLLPPG